MILTNHYLFAFTGIEDDADCTLALDLNDVIEANEGENDYNEIKKIFVIKCQSQIYHFRAENYRIMNIWIKEIKKIIDLNYKSQEYSN